MRILQVNKFFYRRGGSEAYFFDLIKLLEEHGHEVIHFAMHHHQNFDSPYREFFVNEINFEKREGLLADIKKFAHSLYSFEAKRKLEALILKTKPELAHLHNISHHLSPSIFSVLKKYKIPVVQTLHDYQLICPNFKLFTKGTVCERCKKYRYWNAVLYKCVHNSYLESFVESLEMWFHRACKFYENGVYCFVTPSKFLKDRLVEWAVGHRMADIVGHAMADRIIHIPHFLNVDAYEPKYEPGDYIIYFGRLVEEKGLEILLRAIAGTNIRLKIVGEGPELNKLKIKNEKLKIGVEFVGHKSGKVLHDLIRSSKFVVLPSVWYENYPISLLEAGALGKAAVASRLGGIPEIIEDGKNGILVAPGEVGVLKEKIQQLWSDNALCEKMGRRAREMILKKNSPEKHYQKLIEIYKHLL